MICEAGAAVGQATDGEGATTAVENIRGAFLDEQLPQLKRISVAEMLDDIHHLLLIPSIFKYNLEEMVDHPLEKVRGRRQ